MADAEVDELLHRVGSMYKLVILAVRRAKEIAEGAVPLAGAEHKKVTSIALEEIRQGKVFYKGTKGTGAEAASTTKKTKGRGAKAKEKKRVAA